MAIEDLPADIQPIARNLNRSPTEQGELERAYRVRYGDREIDSSGAQSTGESERDRIYKARYGGAGNSGASLNGLPQAPIPELEGGSRGNPATTPPEAQAQELSPEAIQAENERVVVELEQVWGHAAKANLSIAQAVAREFESRTDFPWEKMAEAFIEKFGQARVIMGLFEMGRK
jgi:hypothetical protein